MGIVKMGVQDEASEIKYDNTTSGLVAINVNNAIDEVNGKLGTTVSEIEEKIGEPNGFNRNAPDTLGQMSYDGPTRVFTIEPKIEKPNFSFYSSSTLFEY